MNLTADAARVSLVVVIPPDGSNALVDSVIRTSSALGSRWELVLAGSAASTGPVSSERVGVTADSSSTLGRVMASALENATGDFVVFVSPDGVPSPVLADQIVNELGLRPGADVVYFDEAAGATSPPVVKPAQSPERLRCINYWGSFVVYRTETARVLFKRPLESAGAELYELALRATVASCAVENSRLEVSPAPIGLEQTWYDDDDIRRDGARHALTWYLDAVGGGTVLGVDINGRHITRRNVVGEPLVSIVIPTGGTTGVVRGASRVMVVDAVRSILEKTSYANLEIIIVTDASTPSSVIADLRDVGGDRVILVPWNDPFSFSGKMNYGVLHAGGDFLLFLNDDIEVISPDWIRSMLALAQLPEAGTVGAMLYFENDTIQHAGHAYYKLDVTHVGLHSERGSRGPGSAFLVEREVDGNTAACMMVRRDRFLEVGGLSPLLPGNFNDVDLCLKLAVKGYRSYWTPHAELYHFESMTRDPRISKYEVLVAWGRWEHMLYTSKFWPVDPHVTYHSDS